VEVRNNDLIGKNIQTFTRKTWFINIVYYIFQDLYEDVDYGVLTPQTKIKVKVNPSGVVILRCNLNIDDAFRYSPYSPLNQIFKVRQNSFK